MVAGYTRLRYASCNCHTLQWVSPSGFKQLSVNVGRDRRDGTSPPPGRHLVAGDIGGVKGGKLAGMVQQLETSGPRIHQRFSRW